MCGHHCSCYLLRFCFLILSFMEIDSDDFFSSNFRVSTKTKRPVVFPEYHQITFNFCPNKGNSASLTSKREIPYWKTIKAPRFDDKVLRADDQLWMKDNIKQSGGSWSHNKWEKHNNVSCGSRSVCLLSQVFEFGCLQQISYQRHGMFQKELLQHFRRNEFSITASTKTADLMGVAVEDVERPRHPDQGKACQHLHLSPHILLYHWLPLSLTKSMSLADCFSGHPHVLGIWLEPKRGRLGQPTRMANGRGMVEYQPPSRVS